MLDNRDKHALQIHLIVKIPNDDIDAILTGCWERKVQNAVDG